MTIATNMAGRGTDIILGGNPETLAWARLKDKYAIAPRCARGRMEAHASTRSRRKEKMKEEGRKVAEMGGLHIVGTERHEARRIDNQLRGRAGRQGDPGSSRFYLSLEDDLMRIFAGEWVANVLSRLGMEEGEAIESRMVSRRIEAAQKKVEERNFDIRKNLLEYDEVMDHQRKEVYGYRQEILDGANCKMLHPGHARRADRPGRRALPRRRLRRRQLRRVRGQAAGRRVRCRRTSPAAISTRPSRPPATRPARLSPTQIHEAMEENLSPSGYQGMELAGAGQPGQHPLGPEDHRPPAQADRQGQPGRVPDRAGRQGGRRGRPERGQRFLEHDWGVRSLCDWARLKFQHQADAGGAGQDKTSRTRSRQLLHGRCCGPVPAEGDRVPGGRRHGALHGRPARRRPTGGQRYDREGLYQLGHACASRRPPSDLTEEEFRTQSRARLQEHAARGEPATLPEDGPGGHRRQARRELQRHQAVRSRKTPASWPSGRRPSCGLDVSEATLTGVDQDAGPQGALERLRRQLPAGDARHGAQPAAQPARCGVEEPPLHDGPSALRHRPGAATPRKIRRPSTSGRA